MRLPRIRIPASVYGVIGAACGVLANNPNAWREVIAVVVAALLPGARVDRNETAQGDAANGR